MSRPLALACALLFLAALPPRALSRPPELSWRPVLSIHFKVRSQSPGLPKGFLYRIEKIHSRLSRELWPLGNALRTERVDFILYDDIKSYRASSYGVPPWSDGVALVGGKQPVFLTHRGAGDSLLAHELTHLFVGAYFASGSRTRARVPRWLNEGLAVDMEGGRRLLLTRQPMREFVAASPGVDTPSRRVGAWYAQAASVVRFLRRDRANRARFGRLCEALRNGADPESALFRLYGWRDYEAFDRAWGAWVQEESGSPVEDTP